MAAPYSPVVKGEDLVFYITLEDYANPGNFKLNPTIAAGDFKVSIDGGAFANLATLPSVVPASGASVKVTISTSENNGDSIMVTAIDQTAPKEWGDQSWSWQTQAAAPDATVTSMSAAVCNKIADHILRRSWATAAASGDGDTKSFRSLLGAVARLVNRWNISGSTITFYEADDSTSLGTQALSTTAGVDPVTGADTA